MAILFGNADGVTSAGTVSGRITAANVTIATQRTYFLTFRAYINPGSTAKALFGYAGTADSENCFHSEGNFTFTKNYSGGTRTYTRNTHYPVGSWVRTAFATDFSSPTNSMRMAVDGTLVTISPSGTGTGTPVTPSTSSLYIGDRRALLRVANGHMANFAAWDRILSDSELYALSIGFSPLFFTNSLVFFHRLDNTSQLMAWTGQVLSYTNLGTNVHNSSLSAPYVLVPDTGAHLYKTTTTSSPALPTFRFRGIW